MPRSPRFLLLTLSMCAGMLHHQAQAQFYTREDSLQDRANDVRRAASDLQDRTENLKAQQASTQVLKYKVENWAAEAQSRAAELQKQSQMVDRAKFFADQAATINRANEQEIREQGKAVFAASQQVALRTQELIALEKDLWQWKNLLDQQDAQLKANLDGKDAAHNLTSEEMVRFNERLAAFVASNEARRKPMDQQIEELKNRQKAVAQQEAEAKRLVDEANARRRALRKNEEDLEALDAAVSAARKRMNGE